MKEWFVGSMNDALFIIDRPPRPAPVDYINPHANVKVIAVPTEPHEEGWPFQEYSRHANLIAAAPAMLKALKKIADREGVSAQIARDAIAKIGGINE